ncbi:MAG: hypothetical protein IKS68_02600 [Mailhella sp.]|nr:hypothetical protein [Mailhella sp.]
MGGAFAAVKQQMQNGDPLIYDPQTKKYTGLNDQHYDELRTFLLTKYKKSAVTNTAAYGRAVDLYIKMRRSLDADHLAILERVQSIAPQSKVDALRNQIGSIPFYFPHIRSPVPQAFDRAGQKWTAAGTDTS